MYDIMHLPGVVELGYTGENGFRTIQIDMRPWLQVLPDGVASIVLIRPGETADDAYIAATTMEDGILTWQPGAGDLGEVEGYGQMEVWLEDTNEKRGKSAKCQTFVQGSLSPTSETPPPAQESWLEQMTSLKTETVTAAQSAEDAREAAESAQAAAEVARDAAQAVAGDFQGLSATASGLAAGTSPTVNVTHDEGGLFNLAFGIPKGDKGDQGDPPTDSQVQTAANNYLSQVITNPNSPPLDRALSSNVAAAPADMVGDLKSAFNLLDNAVIKQTTIKRIASGGTAQGGVEMTDAAYIDTNGVRQASSGYRNSGYVEIEALATIDLFMYGLSSFCAVAFYDENKNFISGIIPSGSGWQRISGVQTIPNNAKYYIVTLMNADTTGYAICTDVKRISTEQVAELKEYVDERFEAIINHVKVMVSDISGEGVQNGYVDSSGIFNSTSAWVVTGYIRTDALETIIDHVQVFATFPAVAFYDKYKVFLSTSTSQTTGVQDFSVVVPAEAHYMRFNYYKADATQFYSYNVLEMRANALYIKQLNDALYGKKIGAIGDSITIGTYSAPGMTYVNQIANAHNMTVDNQAIWGSVFPMGKTQNDNPRGSIYSQVASLSADCDIVIISGGINDADYQADDTYWGSVSGGYDETLDTTTFCGAFEGTLKAALDKFKGKPILFVFEHRMTQIYQSTYGQHFENVQYPLMIEMLNKWGIPYADLFHDMPSIKLTPGYIDLYSFDDHGVHPNVAGYRKFYVPRVESALEAIAK